MEIFQTKETPYIKFDPVRKILKIAGRSSPKDAINFYQGLIEALDQHIAQGGDIEIATFALEYFNTSTSKCLLDIMKRLKRMPNKGLIIKWYYETNDEDMLEAGEDLSDILDIQFNFLEVERFE